MQQRVYGVGSSDGDYGSGDGNGGGGGNGCSDDSSGGSGDNSSNDGFCSSSSGSDNNNNVENTIAATKIEPMIVRGESNEATVVAKVD